MILLDSQLVFWSIGRSALVGDHTRALISAAPVRYVSAITRVEFVLKEMRGMLAIPENLDEVLGSSGLTSLPFTDRHAAALQDLPSLARHDPFDRMLLAQAKAERLDFLTTDRVLLELDLSWIIDARN